MYSDYPLEKLDLSDFLHPLDFEDSFEADDNSQSFLINSSIHSPHYNGYKWNIVPLHNLQF